MKIDTLGVVIVLNRNKVRSMRFEYCSIKTALTTIAVHVFDKHDHPSTSSKNASALPHRPIDSMTIPTFEAVGG